MKKKVFIGFNIFVCLLLVWFVFQVHDIQQKKKRVISELKQVNQEIEVYENKRKILEDNQKNLNEEEKVEKIARDRLNLKKKGETTYKIIE